MPKQTKKEQSRIANWYDIISNNKVRHIVGIDNGVTGTIGLLHLSERLTVLQYGIVKTPTMYTDAISKKRVKTKRIEPLLLEAIISSNMNTLDDTVVLLERPLLNPRMFWTSISAAKSMEVTQTVLEMLGFKINLNYFIIDSRDWQSVLLPGVKGSDNLKVESWRIGTQLFPNNSLKHTDMDGLLIAEWLRKEMCK